MPLIQNSQNSTFYWLLYFTGMGLILFVLCLFGFIQYSIYIKKFYFTWPSKLLRAMLLFLFWFLFTPLFESFISIFRCNNGYHYIVSSLQCFNGIHIAFVVLSVVFSLLLFLICFLTSLLYNETQPVPEDSFARFDKCNKCT